jgi:hypothetical protein
LQNNPPLYIRRKEKNLLHIKKKETEKYIENLLEEARPRLISIDNFIFLHDLKFLKKILEKK